MPIGTWCETLDEAVTLVLLLAKDDSERVIKMLMVSDPAEGGSTCISIKLNSRLLGIPPVYPRMKLNRIVDRIPEPNEHDSVMFIIEALTAKGKKVYTWHPWRETPPEKNHLDSSKFSI